MIEKLKAIKKGFDDSLISREEYEQKKKEIEEKIDDEKKKNKNTGSSKEIAKKSDKALLISLFLILVFIAALVFFISLKSQARPKTIDELHQANLEAGLPQEQGYTYNHFSFVKIAELWYTQIQSESGKTLYSVPFHFAPKELEDVKLFGELNNTLFNSDDKVYVTFNPLDENLQYIALAIGEFDQSIIKSFGKMPVAACAKNETEACRTRPIITCENTKKPVAYFRQDKKTMVTYKGNCIILQGKDIEIVRATDRMLMQFYGIMK